MPYRIRKARNQDLYYVIDNYGVKLEKKPIPLERARKQIIAIHISKVKSNQPYDVFGKKKKNDILRYNK